MLRKSFGYSRKWALLKQTQRRFSASTLKEYINVLKNSSIRGINNFDEFLQTHQLDLKSICQNEIDVRKNFRVSEYESFRGFENEPLAKLNIPGITIVRDKASAQRALQVLKQFKHRVHAWDTETIDLNIKAESPVMNGKIICLQAFLGMDVPFENGPRLFIDNFGDSHDLIHEFKEYFEDPSYKKIWFNYGFDRHLVNNHKIELSGFDGDVMHMARLLDPSRGPADYSLAKISVFYEDEILAAKKTEKESFLKEIQEIDNGISLFEVCVYKYRYLCLKGKEMIIHFDYDIYLIWIFLLGKRNYKLRVI